MAVVQNQLFHASLEGGVPRVNLEDAAAIHPSSPSADGDVVSDYTALLSGNYWNGIETSGTPVIVTFSFPTSAPAYDINVQGFTSATVSSFQAFNSDERTQAINALKEWAAASDITFVQVAPGQGDINFQLVDLATSSYGSPGGIGFYPFGNWNYFTYPNFSSDLDSSGDVFMNDQYATDGTVNYGTLLHEIGHALGLKHPTEDVYDGAAGVDHDQVLDSDDPTRTVMATVGDGTPGDDVHLKDLDKAAVAYIYGASGGQVVTDADLTSGTKSGSNSVSSWTWNGATQTLTQTATSAGETIRGSSVTDVISATSGNNRLYGLNGNDRLTTGSGADYLDGGPGADVMTGGGGDDTYAVDNAGDQVIEGGGGGYDTIQAYASFTMAANTEQLSLFGQGLTGTGTANGDHIYADGVYGSTLIGLAGADYMVGGMGSDTIDGGADGDSIYGQNGNDVLIAGSGTNYVDGGSGFDTIDYSALSTAVTATLKNTGTGTTGGEGDSLLNIEHVRGGSGNDTLTAGNRTGTTGTIAKGKATLDDDAADAVALDGSFTYNSNAAIPQSTTIPHTSVSAHSAGEAEYYSFSVASAGSAATVYASGTSSNFTDPWITILDATGQVLASGAPGSSGLSYTFATTGEYYVEVQRAATDSFGNHLAVPVDGYYGLSVSLTNALDYWLEGGAGNDTLIAGVNGDARFDGGAGTDTLSFVNATAVTADLTAGTATGAWGVDQISNVENLTGSIANDTLIGNSAANILDGGSGADTMSGGSGDDTYYVNNPGDVVIEQGTNGGNDQVFSATSFSLSGQYIEKLTLTGTAGNKAYGTHLANTLIGNDAANVLDGLGGNDILTGGGGADKFVFDSALDGSGNVDTITDFTLGQDLIYLDQTIFSQISAIGTLSSAGFAVGTSATTTSQRIIYDSGSGALYYDADGSGAGAKVQFAQIGKNLALTSSSFRVIA